MKHEQAVEILEGQVYKLTRLLIRYMAYKRSETWGLTWRKRKNLKAAIKTLTNDQ